MNKVRGGDSHGGAQIYTSDQQEYQDLQTFLGLLGDVEPSPQPTAQPQIFKDVALAPSSTTLRRAALILAGRIPTEAEEQLAASGGAGLQQAIRGLMQGQAFHDFLLRAANDRLLFEGLLNGVAFDITDPNYPFYKRLADRQFTLRTAGNDEQFWQEQYRFAISLALAPLELIAYVVENDRPYTEILTADYTMLNPYTAAVFDPDMAFAGTDLRDFRPGTQRGHIRQDDQYRAEYFEGVGLRIDGFSGYVDYPHAGILNEPAFLSRYPSTETNRNRARARWTALHFLGVDIEKSASRTTDPVALADTNNPTLNNPACTVCHQILDPIAGTFQNYGNEGWYRSSYPGVDALPDTYKYGEGSPYQFGDTWYRDMRLPGFEGENFTPRSPNSLQTLAQRITADPRFAEATVRFWWPALMAGDVLAAPETSADADFGPRLDAYEAQQRSIRELADGFRSGFSSGSAYNLRDLLTQMVLSPWFRAESVEDTLSASQQVALTTSGTSRLLTPEELNAKTRSLFGRSWGEFDNPSDVFDGRYERLLDTYRLYYGGIDSSGTKVRATETNTVMSAVALTQALVMPCYTVIEEFSKPRAERRLFTQVEKNTSPTTIGARSQTLQAVADGAREWIELEAEAQGGRATRISIAMDTPFYDEASRRSTYLIVYRFEVLAPNGAVLFGVNGDRFETSSGFEISTWEDGNPTGGPYYDSQGFVGWSLYGRQLSLGYLPQSTGPLRVRAQVARTQDVSARPVQATLGWNTTDPAVPSVGRQAVRDQLRLLHQRMLGESLEDPSIELDASYDLFVDIWQERRMLPTAGSLVDWETEVCDVPIPGWFEVDRSAEFSDPQSAASTWISMLISFMSDFRYLHE